VLYLSICSQLHGRIASLPGICGLTGLVLAHAGEIGVVKILFQGLMSSVAQKIGNLAAIGRSAPYSRGVGLFKGHLLPAYPQIYSHWMPLYYLLVTALLHHPDISHRHTDIKAEAMSFQHSNDQPLSPRVMILQRAQPSYIRGPVREVSKPGICPYSPSTFCDATTPMTVSPATTHFRAVPS
jgi:hypothetical protein